MDIKKPAVAVSGILAVSLSCRLLSLAASFEEAAQNIAEQSARSADELHSRLKSSPDAVKKRVCQNQKDLNDAFLKEVKRDNVEDAKNLLDHGAQAFAKDQDGTSALMYAAQNDNLNLAGLLLARGAFVNTKADNGVTALYFAKSAAMVKLLAAHHAQLDVKYDSARSTKLLLAIYNHQEDVAQALLELHADPNIPDAYGASPFLYAAVDSSVDFLKSLVAYGADFTRRDSIGDSALAWAAKSGSVDKLRYVLSLGNFPIDEKNRSGLTAFWYAATGWHPEATQFLISQGADKNVVHEHGVAYTAVMTIAAGCYRYSEISDEEKANGLSALRVLIQNKADLNYRNGSGITALSLAESLATSYPNGYNSICTDIYTALKDAGAQK